MRVYIRSGGESSRKAVVYIRVQRDRATAIVKMFIPPFVFVIQAFTLPPVVLVGCNELLLLVGFVDRGELVLREELVGRGKPEPVETVGSDRFVLSTGPDGSVVPVGVVGPGKFVGVAGPGGSVGIVGPDRPEGVLMLEDFPVVKSGVMVVVGVVVVGVGVSDDGSGEGRIGVVGSALFSIS